MAMFNPAHPGELIRETMTAIMEETGTTLTVQELADNLATTRKNLSAIINCRQSVSPEMAVKLAVAFTNTTAEFWLRVQNNYDLFRARNKVDVSQIKVIWKAA